jgi:hypothetical protein
MNRAQLLALGKRFGAAGQFVTQQALYAQRPQVDQSADRSPQLRAAAGIGKTSVFHGPARSERAGQPIFRQYSV